LTNTIVNHGRAPAVAMAALRGQPCWPEGASAAAVGRLWRVLRYAGFCYPAPDPS
jgi:hypothetical protein